MTMIDEDAPLREHAARVLAGTDLDFPTAYAVASGTTPAANAAGLAMRDGWALAEQVTR